VSAGALTGKVAVVVGGSSGFGRGIAERFLAEGARVVVAARNAEKLEVVAKELGASAVTCDATQNDSLESLATAVIDQFGQLDIAINSAGYEDNTPIRDMTPEKLEPMVAVQFTGAVYFIRHMANAMKQGGSVITISSLTATLVAEGYAHYAGAKAGINHTSRIAASEYGEAGIRVNVVSPTLIETPMTAPLLAVPGVAQAFLEETPLGRIGAIEDVVNAVTWLSSDQAAYITGQNIHIDGGTSLRRLPRAADFMRAMAASAKEASE
jgi:NAD(P)-dependent dehydrogenase (short-subunit alcohol dehydrogenase family)